MYLQTVQYVQYVKFVPCVSYVLYSVCITFRSYVMYSMQGVYSLHVCTYVHMYVFTTKYTKEYSKY